MPEMKTLTINDITFDITDDGAVRFDSAQELTENQKAQARANIGFEVGEPAEYDIPKVFISGTIPTAKDDVLAEMQYISKTESFSAYLKIKCQGSSSMSYPKKNFTIKMYSDEARMAKLKKTFKDWGHASNKYVLKANYIDHSHARNIVSARLWDEVVSSRESYSSLPSEMRNSPCNGAIDGFPIKLYANGTYQGIYTWNIGKDDWMWGMDEDNANHVLLCGETNTNDAYAENACNFRALWSGVNEDAWNVEIGTNDEVLKDSLNALIACVKDTDNITFKATIGDYLDVQSAIDYYLHMYVICGLDGLARNMLLATYDRRKWICGAYDMDSTFGLWWTGNSFVSATFRCPEDYQEKHSLLWERISTVFAEEMKQRYTELRSSVYSLGNMITHFERFTDTIGKDLYAEDLEVYTGIPSGSTNNIKQIRDYIRDRLAYVDSKMRLSDDILFEVANEVTLNGTSDSIDTGVDITTMEEYTVVMDFTTLATTGVLLSCFTNPYGFKIKANGIIDNNKPSIFAPYGTTMPTNERCVFVLRRTADGAYKGFTSAHCKLGTNLATTEGTAGKTLRIGAYDYHGNITDFANMTVHGFRLYSRALDDAEIMSFYPADVINLADNVYEEGRFAAAGTEHLDNPNYSFRSANYLPVEGGKTISAEIDTSLTLVGNPILQIVQYNSNKEIIVARADTYFNWVNGEDKWQVSSNSKTFTLDANTAYIRYCMYLSENSGFDASKLNEIEVFVYYD